MAIAIFLACAWVGGVCSSNGIQFDDSYSQKDEELDDSVEKTSKLASKRD
jgi:hypothetical protein